MVKVSCKTNLDLLPGEQWPTSLPERPQVGDIIRSGLERKPNWCLELQVVRVSWVKPKEGDWYLEVELHMVSNRYTTLHDFYEHYGRLTNRPKSFFI